MFNGKYFINGLNLPLNRPKGENYVLQYVGPRQKAERLFKVMALSKGTSRGVSQSDEYLKMNQTQGLSKDNGNAFANLSDEGSAVVSTELKTSRNKSAPISFKGGSAWQLSCT